MGARPSQETTDIRMEEITDDVISKFQHSDKLIYNGRYRDDGFIIFNGSPDEIKEFFDIGNSCHKYLRFTYELSHTSFNFFDTTIYKGTRFSDSQRLDIRSYIKPTNSFQYLHRQSVHSSSVFKGLITRHLRNTSDQAVLLNIFKDFKTHLKIKEVTNNQKLNLLCKKLFLQIEWIFSINKRRKTIKRLYLTFW